VCDGIKYLGTSCIWLYSCLSISMDSVSWLQPTMHRKYVREHRMSMLNISIFVLPKQ
jgi:disulfide oxidoreductase YuzD